MKGKLYKEIIKINVFINENGLFYGYYIILFSKSDKIFNSNIRRKKKYLNLKTI